MLYEIINPSDPYTIDCPDLAIATVACVLLGAGQYAFVPQDGTTTDEEVKLGDRGVPMFLFGGEDAFATKHFGMTMQGLLRDVRNAPERRLALATALDSV